MNKVLYNYLQYRFYNDNIIKYHKCFRYWIANLTENQIYYFNIDMQKNYKL